MAEDAKPPLSQKLVMTPQLMMAIKMLGTPTSQLAKLIEQWLAEHPGSLAPLAPGEPDPADELERQRAPGDDPSPWFYLDQPPLPARGGLPPDVWVFGNPPQARANGRASQRMKVANGLREAEWFVRSLRQRARSYERFVAGVLSVHPGLAIAIDPAKEKPIPLRQVVESAGMHESTIKRVCVGCRFQTLHGVFRFEDKRAGLVVRPGT